MNSSGMKPDSVAALFKECSEAEKRSNRAAVEQLKFDTASYLTFRGTFFEAFSKHTCDPPELDSELAARYRVLVKVFRETQDPDQRLKLLGQWLWAELNLTPEDSLGKSEVERLISVEDWKRLKGIQSNDLYYANLLRIWLPYSEGLFQDAKSVRGTISNLNAHLLKLGYEAKAVEIFTGKAWRSPIEFTCEWLATRGGIEMDKQRENSDMGRTLRNSYTKIFGKGAPHLID